MPDVENRYSRWLDLVSELLLRPDHSTFPRDEVELLLAQQRLAESEQDLEHFLILPVDAAAAAEFDRLRKLKGSKKIGRSDLLIAAITLANRGTLVTRNVKDFRLVTGLQVENWAD